jgi:hypothetical protein
MKRLFLLVLVSALLVTLGFAQTPAAGGNTDPANVIGCLGGSDGNYTVAENGTRQIFKITTSNVDLKPHVGHDVKLIGHKASGAVGSGAADNSFAVTELSMISEHCATAAATVGAVVPYSQTVLEPTTATPAPSAPASTPAVDAAAPAATVSPSAATVSTPAVDAAAPAAAVSPSAATVGTPAVDAAAPAATVSPSATTVSTPAVEAVTPAAAVSPSSETVSPPAAKAAQPTRPSAHPHKPSVTKAAAATAPAATVDPSSETVSPPAADAPTPPDAATPAATASPSSESDSTPASAAPIPTVIRRTGSLTLLISFVVLVVVLGTLAPLFGRWRKRKMLERTGTPNLSFTHEVSSDLDKPEPRKVA